MLYSCDWAFEDDKYLFYDGNKISKKPSFQKGDMVVTENIPNKLVKKLLEDEIEIYRVHQNLISEYRDELKIEKSDENDVKLIFDYYQKNPEAFKRYSGESKLNNLYATFKETQKLRVSTGNRLWANGDKANDMTLKALEKLEGDITKEMTLELERYPIWGWLKQIKGISTATAAGLIAYTRDMSRFPYASHLMSYYGLHVVDGKAPKKAKGVQCNYIQNGRSLVLGIIGDNFIKQRTEVYRDVYDNEKKRLRQLYPESIDNPQYLATKKGFKKMYTDGHVHRMAIRKMMKVFMCHYWVLDRQLHGLSTEPLYVHDQLKHNTYIKPPHIPESLLPFNPIRNNHLSCETHTTSMNQPGLETHPLHMNHHVFEIQ